MGRYRKKPVEIEAFRMGIDARPDWFQDKVSTNEIITFVVAENRIEGELTNPFKYNKTGCIITTLEGDMTGDYGDYIIQGVKGEVYPCKPDIFELTYEMVEKTNENDRIEISKSNYELFEKTGLLEENPNKVNIAELMKSEAMQLLRDELEEESNENTK
jgi:hypothetical protein